MATMMYNNIRINLTFHNHFGVGYFPTKTRILSHWDKIANIQMPRKATCRQCVTSYLQSCVFSFAETSVETSLGRN